jgi:peptidase M28-like protein
MKIHRASVLLFLLACQAHRAPPAFDGDRALEYVRAQVAFGPRVPNTTGHRRTGDWILEQLRRTADSVEVEAWTQVTRKGDTLRLRNFLARFRPAATERVLLVAHWDTRPKADKSANLGQQDLPVPGANDGASGVAVLLGVADALKATPPAVGVDLLFVDGEDYGTDFNDSTETLIGAWRFASRRPAGYQPLYAVVFDMVGDRDLEIFQEAYSVQGAPEVVERVWRTAEDIGHGRVFRRDVRHTLTDDHIPLQRVGIRAIDVIDFDYPHWHTTDDTVDKVSARSLQIVGEVAVALVR